MPYLFEDRSASRRHVLAGLAALGVSALASTLAVTARASQPVLAGGTGSALAMFDIIARQARRISASVPELSGLAPLGSGAAVAALRSGKLDLGLLGRPLSATETAEDLVAVPYAETPLCFVTDPANPVRALSLTEVVRILSGEQRTWPDGKPIRIVRRPASEGDHLILTQAAPELAPAIEALQLIPGLPVAGNDIENATLLESRPRTFGVMTLGQLMAEGRRLVPIAIDGTEPSLESLRGGAWRFAKRFHAARRADAHAGVLELFDVLPGHAATAALLAYGHLPVGREG